MGVVLQCPKKSGLGAGKACEVAFLTGRPRTASVVAMDKSRVFEFKKLLLEEIFEKNPEALRRLHDFYECRIEDTLKKITSATKKIGH